MRLLALLVVAALSGCAAGPLESAAPETIPEDVFSVLVKNDAERAFEARVGFDGAILCTFEVPKGQSKLCNTRKQLDGEPHLYFVRARAGDWDISERESLSAINVRATVRLSGVSFTG